MPPFRDLFVWSPTRSFVMPRAAGDEPPAGRGAFITPETLTTFAGASSVIAIVSRVIAVLWAGSDERVVAATVALVVGCIIFAVNVTDPRAAPTTGRDWLIASVVGAVNTVYLIAVALGVSELAAPDGSAGT